MDNETGRFTSVAEDSLCDKTGTRTSMSSESVCGNDASFRALMHHHDCLIMATAGAKS